jgi:hypothetical protein
LAKVLGVDEIQGDKCNIEKESINRKEKFEVVCGNLRNLPMYTEASMYTHTKGQRMRGRERERERERVRE